MPKYKATAYIRLSYTDDHSSESDSVSNQRKLIENFVERNPDIEVVSEKIDDGYSGIIFDRPAFKEMMQDVTDGNINCVIVKDLSRLGREYIETGRYLRRVFPAYGVRFIAITDSIDTAHDSGDDLTVSVKNIMNEAYCRDISIKTRSSLDVKRRNGDFVGAFPVYGYMKAEDNKNLLVPDPYAARVVCDIFRMRLEGASASKIASELNRLGILSPAGIQEEQWPALCEKWLCGQGRLQVVGNHHHPHLAGRNLYRNTGAGQTGYAALQDQADGAAPRLRVGARPGCPRSADRPSGF